MTFQFATCERSTALGFLKKLYPHADVSDTPECAGPVLDFVEKDYIRIPDPMMHGMTVSIFPTNKCPKDLIPSITSALQAMNTRLLASTKGD